MTLSKQLLGQTQPQRARAQDDVESGRRHEILPFDDVRDVNISDHVAGVNMIAYAGAMNPSVKAPRSYHHGQLREALLATGLELAAAGGPEAVTIREAARRNGVSPNAAYRHFTDHQEFLAEVASRVRSILARAMLAEQALVPDSDPRSQALARMKAVGKGYLRFACESPLLFRSAYIDCRIEDSAPAAGSVLNDVLETCVAAGIFPAESFDATRAAAWATVHGFAYLAIDGMLGVPCDEAIEAFGDRVLDVIVQGISA